MALNDLWKRLTNLDRFIVAFLLLMCVGLFVLLGFRSPGQEIHVEQSGAVIYKSPLKVDRKVELQGPLGTTILEIIAGSARILSSPCPFKVCIGMGAVSHSGEILACVPNRLLIQVVGKGDLEKDPGYDLLSR